MEDFAINNLKIISSKKGIHELVYLKISRNHREIIIKVIEKIAKQYNLSILDIKQWNNLHSDNLSIGDKLILFIPDES